MNNFDEMTRDQFLVALRADDACKFIEIPTTYLDSEVIATWLEFHGELHQVPKQYVDDEHRRFAVGRSHDHQLVRDYPLAVIKKEETECYEELVLIALAQCYLNMTHVDRRLYSEAFFLKALEVNRLALIMFLTGAPDKPRIDWTQAMIDSAVIKDFRYLPYFPKEQIRKECLERLITGGEHSAADLEKYGLLDLMSDLMRGGYWPYGMNKPSSLVEAIDLLRQNHPSAENLEVYYRAFIRSQPMETVLPLMTSPDLQSLMLQVYSTEELTPHLRTGLLKVASKVRGHLLEEGLGL
jgi:hypothetical protein